MRILVSAALALSMFAGTALAAEALSPEAEAGVAVAKQFAKSKTVSFRKVKVGPDGMVCGLTSTGGGSDMQFMVDTAAETLWLNEDPGEPNSDFGYGDNVLRSTDRAAYAKWKACQKGA